MTDRFELIEQVGKGGMGAVWKARDLETGQVIALKLLHAHLSDEEDYVQRLEREVEIAQRIDSPNVVRVLGYGVHDGIPYMAMEFVDGKSLRQMLRDDGPMDWDGPFGVREILRQVAAALAVVHSAGIIHRDIKPSNILVNDEGVVKVADFGISRAMDLTRVTGLATMLGTPAYMSPDIDQGPASDLYALGCVAFEMLTGTPPFEGHTQQEVLMRHMRDQPDLSRLPSATRRVVGKLLEKQVLNRPASAETLLALLADEGGSGANVRLWMAIAAPIGILGIAGAVIFGVFARGDGGPVEAATVGPTASATATATTATASPSATASPTIHFDFPLTPTPTGTAVPPRTEVPLVATLAPTSVPTSTPTPTRQPPTATATAPRPTPTPTSPPPPTSTPTATPTSSQSTAKLQGFLSPAVVTSYCQGLGFASAFQIGNTWVCQPFVGSATRTVDPNVACRQAYLSEHQSYALLVGDGPNAWQCFGY